MNILSIIILALIAVFLASGIERLLRQYQRKLKDDCSRINVAQDALKRQRDLIDRVMDDRSIPPSIKAFVVEVSAIIPDREMAYKLATWFEAGMPSPPGSEKADAEADQLFDNLRSLSKSNQEAFELVTSALRGALVTTMLQWPVTARCMQRLYYKLAVETTTEVAKSAASVHRAARLHHWADTEPLAA